jgi:hypothetical protein
VWVQGAPTADLPEGPELVDDAIALLERFPSAAFSLADLLKARCLCSTDDAMVRGASECERVRERKGAGERLTEGLHERRVLMTNMVCGPSLTAGHLQAPG